jgi:predicted tellurium resistance membrane protein TerC
VLLLGLLLSVVLTSFAANLLADLLERHRWIAWVGLLIVLDVALNMISHGWVEVAGAMTHLSAAQPLEPVLTRRAGSPMFR